MQHTTAEDPYSVNLAVYAKRGHQHVM